MTHPALGTPVNGVPIVSTPSGPSAVRPSYPDPILTDNALSVLGQRYLIRDPDGKIRETPREMFGRVARAIADAEVADDRQRVADVFYGRMARLEFLPNTPCLVNAGRPGGFNQFSACFVIPVPDTMDGVFTAIRQMALTHKSGGGCIGGESVVLTDKGPMTMRSLVEGRRDVSVLSYTGGTGVADWRLVAQHHTTETDVVYEVDLDGQASIRASGWHPFFVWRGDRIDEVRADELVPGDAIVGSTRWDGRLSDLSMRAWLAGFVVSDGGFDESVNGLRLRICKGHEEPIRRAAEEIGCSYDLSNDQRYRSPVWELCKVGTGAREILDQFGDGPFDVYNKRLPSWTWLAPVHEQVSLLIGLLDGDGWIEPDSGDLAYGTVSQRLAMEVEALCGMLGIRTRRRDRAPDDGSNEASFCEITLARSPWLSDAVNAHSARHRMSWSHTRGVISLDRKYVGMLGEIGHPIHTNEAWRRGIEIDGHRVVVQRWRREGLATREVAALVLRDLGLETYASAVHSARIVRSVKTGGSDTLYDLTVPGTQNYVAGVGGFVVAHNTGFAFSRLRAAGRAVRTTSGVASGPISFMRPFNAATEATKQGGVRRGANMGVLRVDHPDILAFIRIKANDLREMENFNLSVGITDAFMAALDGDREYALVHPETGETASSVRARDVWNEIVRCAHVVGDPGLVFLDRANALDPLTEALGPIEATNPCQPAWATVLTPDGIRALGNVGVGDRIWSGQRWAKIVRKVHTGVKRVNAYRTRAGTFYGTENHRVVDGGRKLEVRAAESIDASTGPDATPLFPVPYARNRQHVLDGLILGDGTYHRASGRVFLCAGPDEIEAYRAELGDLIGAHRPGVKDTCYEARTSYRSLPRTYDRDIGDEWLCGDVGRTADFLRGLYSANGSVAGNRVTLKATSFDVIESVQQMLSSLGISSYYTVNKPTDITHHNGTYTSRQSYDLNIGNAEGRARFAMLVGFIQQHKTERLRATLDVQSQRAIKLSYDIVEIEEMGEEDVYDITIDAPEHTYWTGGLLVSNCGEVPLRGNDACSLGSINLDKFVVGGDVDTGALLDCVRDATRFLDNMITLSEYPEAEIRRVVDQSRKVGLGVMGWADALIRLGVPYASKQALDIADTIMRQISVTAIQASERLAEERGPFGAWEQSRWAKEGRRPRRNATNTVIAPTGTISIIAGCSSGIEPLYALSMTRNQAGLVMQEVHPAVEREGRRRDWWSPAVADHVRAKGSLYGAPGVPDHARHLFSIANEIDVADHVRMQAVFQRHVEDGVSKTINLRSSATPEDIDGAYRLAWTAGCKGITVYRDGCRDRQVLVAGTGAGAASSSPSTPVAPAPVSLARRGIPRDGRRSGHTITERTPFGNAHVTINEHPDDDEPFEVFVRIGKSGSEVMAWTEAFGRATSYLLSMPGPVSPRERLAEVAQQLADIGGGSQVGIGPDAVVSAPDAIAKILRAYLSGPSVVRPSDSAGPSAPTSSQEVTQRSTPPLRRARRESTLPATRLDLCPSCGKATLTREQRCGVCTSCGFSKC